MKSLLMILSVFLIIGCGSQNNSSSTTGLPAWSQADYQTALAGCIGSAQGSGFTNTQIDTYCNCMVTATEAKWSADDFAKDSADDSAELITNGTAHGCTQEAIK